MRRAAKTDRNHALIRHALRQVGWFVVDTSAVGGGFPDLVCAKAGRCVLVEVKDGAKAPSARRLTAAQQALHAELEAAGMPVAVITAVEEAVNL